MRIISEIPEYIVNEIRAHIIKGRYSSIEAFILAAVENQLALERKPSLKVKRMGAIHTKTVQEVISLKFPELELNIDKHIQTLSPPSFEKLNPTGAISEKELWIWGQINKILPIKFVIRLLANRISEGDQYVRFEEFVQDACSLARSFGAVLLAYDKEVQRRRDERFSIGFPAGQNEEKALSRFALQFIGYIRKKDDVLSGALPSLKFANITEDNNNQLIGLTIAGLAFACLRNPILDDFSFSSRLSKEEVDFYLLHISKNVPGEAYVFKLILSLIEDGTNTREGINTAIQQYTPSGWSSKVLNTQRAGAMSRLFELGLIEKLRDSIFVKYIVTDRGRDFLQLQYK